MKITYIEHSGFYMETEDADFLFDYYKGEIPKREKDKLLVVFVSHRHHDHYNPEIFSLIKEHPDTRYVLSKDVPVKKEVARYEAQGVDLAAHITAVIKNQTYVMDMPKGEKLTIETLKSTDAGVAFLLSYKGKTIYHAGDLNLWLWAGESKQFNENMTKAYFAQLDKLKGSKIDVAFVPLDPRQEKDAFAGMESFLSYTESKAVFPMHMWGEYQIIDVFLQKHKECEGQVRRLKREGESFELYV